jgi:hypothetical protein
MGRSSGDLARALPRVQYKAEFAELPHPAGYSVHRPPHAYREFHVGHIGKVAEAVKDFLLPVGTDRITFVIDGSVSTTGFTIANNGSGGFAYWIADGV